MAVELETLVWYTPLLRGIIAFTESQYKTDLDFTVAFTTLRLAKLMENNKSNNFIFIVDKGHAQLKTSAIQLLLPSFSLFGASICSLPVTYDRSTAQLMDSQIHKPATVQ